MTNNPAAAPPEQTPEPAAELRSLKQSLWEFLKAHGATIPARGSDHDRILLALGSLATPTSPAPAPEPLNDVHALVSDVKAAASIIRDIAGHRDLTKHAFADAFEDRLVASLTHHRVRGVPMVPKHDLDEALRRIERWERDYASLDAAYDALQMSDKAPASSLPGGDTEPTAREDLQVWASWGDDEDEPDCGYPLVVRNLAREVMQLRRGVGNISKERLALTAYMDSIQYSEPWTRAHRAEVDRRTDALVGAVWTDSYNWQSAPVVPPSPGGAEAPKIARAAILAAAMQCWRERPLIGEHRMNFGWGNLSGEAKVEYIFANANEIWSRAASSVSGAATTAKGGVG